MTGSVGAPGAAPDREIDLTRYAVPFHRLDDGAEIPWGESVVARRVPSGPDLYARVSIHPSPVLRVVFHGAVRAAVDTYPRFDRITSSLRSGDAFVSVADPTLRTAPDLELAWYLGGQHWDPISTLRSLVLDAAARVGAHRIVLIGGSGGGFAALRLGASIPGSLAFVFNPQVVLRSYIPRVLDAYLRTAGLTSQSERARALATDRLDLCALYTAGEPANFVYYLQNLRDHTHVRSHYVPFKRALGVTGASGTSPDGHARFSLIDGERDGHGPPTRAEFDRAWARALRWYADAT